MSSRSGGPKALQALEDRTEGGTRAGGTTGSVVDAL